VKHPARFSHMRTAIFIDGEHVFIFRDNHVPYWYVGSIRDGKFIPDRPGMRALYANQVFDLRRALAERKIRSNF